MYPAVLDDQQPPSGGGGGLGVVVGGDALLRGLGLLLEGVQVKHGHIEQYTLQGAYHNIGQSLRVPLMPLSWGL